MVDTNNISVVKHYTMKHVCKIVYGLWPTIMDMAIALNESPIVLMDAQKAGKLPDERFDDTFVMWSGFNGGTLTHKHLQKQRLKEGSL